MNIIFKEIKMNLKVLFFWALGLGFFAIASFTKLSTLSSDPESLHSVVNFMPKIVKVLFGLGNPDITSPSGIIAMVMYYMLVIITIYASMAGASLILKEEKDKTSEFLLVKPKSRKSIFVLKTVAGIIMLALLILSVFLFNYYSLKFTMNDTSHTWLILRYCVSIFVAALFFFGLGTFIGSIVRKLKTGTNVSLLFFGIGFTAMLVSQMSEKVEFIDRYNPFSLILNSDFNDDKMLIIKCILILSLFLIITALGAVQYNKKDIFT